MKLKLLTLGLVSFSAAAFAASPAVDFHEHLGLQMWSLRDTTKTDMKAALDLVKQYGLKEVEAAGTGNLTQEQYIAELKARGIKVIGMHAGYELLEKDLALQIATAKALGATYLICPWIAHPKEGLSEELAHKVAQNFNTWGKACRAAGIKLGLHPHGFEFVPTKAGHGETVFDLIARETDPENLCFEMDVFWVFHAGQDPVTLLKKYGSRWQLLHVKDIRKGAVTGLSTGSAPPTDNVAVGTGQIDWPAVLRTSQELGIKYYLIEDETPTPLQAIPDSLKYLRGLKL
ncbi:MAG: sugar phosphate isomerase/epimerase [Opitutus sp.]